MLTKLRDSFKSNPRFYYAMSIAATWAGAGSFIVGTQVAQTAGIFPWLLWALGNTLTCIVFGIFAQKFPKLREVANSKPVQILMGLMCVFQIWVNMGGIYEMLAPTVIGSTAAYIIVYALSAFFIVFYLKRATFRNVTTDNFSWTIVYLLIGILVIYSMITNGIQGIPTVIDPVQLKAKGWTCITLAFGAFFYPTFWELLDYNDANEDETKKVDMKRPFIMGGLLFGFYLLFVLAGSLTTYSPAVNLLKGILVSLVAIYSLGVDDIEVFEEFIKELGDDLEIPGYDTELLETLTADMSDVDDILSGYGTVTEKKKEQIANTAVQYQEQEEIHAAAAEEVKPVAPPPTEETPELEKIDRRFIQCPHCGKRIWL